tara:strand:+ start:137 stop:586 length:450 start_codon:yes stop_codon:yes gene_type:complete
MAAGETKAFNDAVLKARKGVYAEGDTWQLVFLSDTYASINTDLTNPTSATFTPVVGGNVAASYTLASITIDRVTNVIKFDAADIGQILKNASNPADLKTALLRNATVTNDAIQAWDMTADGTTSLDLINNDFTFSFGAGGINTSTNQSA